jgi:ubiquitin-conjugating enzyme E2 M
MVGLQYLFLEPNAEDPLNKGLSLSSLYSCGFLTMWIYTEAAEDLRKSRDQFTSNVKLSLQGRTIKGVQYDKVLI